jgi:hypothetical protein
MDVATISALAATAAAIGAFSVAGVQLYVGHRQSEAALKAAEAALMNAQSAGRHTVAEFRQSWMDKVIDALSEYHAILMSIGGDSLSRDDHMKLTALWTRLELLLKPDEAAAASLLKLADAARLSKTAAERDQHAHDMVQLARSLLKTEWVTIQIELQ